MDVVTLRRASRARCGTGRRLNSGLNAGLRLAGCTTVNVKPFCAQVGEESISLATPTELASGAEYEGRAELGTPVLGPQRASHLNPGRF
jgi:hypothetical protein